MLLAILFLAAAAVLAVDIDKISNSDYQKTKDLSYTTLEAAVVCVQRMERRAH